MRSSISFDEDKFTVNRRYRGVVLATIGYGEVTPDRLPRGLLQSSSVSSVWVWPKWEILRYGTEAPTSLLLKRVILLPNAFWGTGEVWKAAGLVVTPTDGYKKRKRSRTRSGSTIHAGVSQLV